MRIHFDSEENITLAAVGNRLRVGPAARVLRRAKPDTLAYVPYRPLLLASHRRGHFVPGLSSL